MHGFDERYFVQQVAGLSQLAGELMLVRPLIIDLGWGKLRSALANLPNAGFAASSDAAQMRKLLLDQYVAAFRHVERGASDAAKSALKELAASVASHVATEQQRTVAPLVEGQRAKLG
jgi:hypothetical protein